MTDDPTTPTIEEDWRTVDNALVSFGRGILAYSRLHAQHEADQRRIADLDDLSEWSHRRALAQAADAGKFVVTQTPTAGASVPQGSELVYTTKLN